MVKTFQKLWQFSEKRHKALNGALLCSFLNSALGITQLLAIIAAVQVLTGALEPKAGVIRVVILTLICVIGSFAASYFQQIDSITAGMYMTADQRTAVARHLRRMPLGFFRQATAERIIATLTSTLQGVEGACTSFIVLTLTGLLNAAAMFVFMLFYDWRIGLLMGAGMVLYLLVVRWQMDGSRKNAPIRQKAQTDMTGAVLTYVRGIRVTKAFTPENGDAQLQKTFEDSCDANIRLTDRSMPGQFAAHLTIALFESALLALTLYFAAVTGEFGLQKTIVLLIFSFFAYASLNQAGSVLSMIGMIESGLDEIAEIQSQPELPETGSQEPDGEEIVLEDVRFSYGDREILHGITARLRPHTLTAVIGPSGSGKTTLCRLIARFQDVDSGRITLGGADIRSIPYERLMEKISMVFQNVYLFEDTVLNNIRFGRPDATLEEVRQAAKAARCDDFILSLPDGYDTVLTEGGSSLSGGEKQRISIARAILKDSPIIILDEATSALDAENERAFFDAVKELIRSKTVIMIAHRLSTVRQADLILSVKDGELVQSGTPAELAAQPGIYADFLKARETAAGWQL